ncbi:putative ferric-chelate reductase 1 isoform X3 [Octopus vulgaris]|uniref:Ferric-chelate reductase 1 isoform X3 n=1 Tax=Octopus vulgaris TaxID=6645 RepID=A0AA36FKK4_OCTVU|nr:putative ferric-chelate reductase 1 isoform X3 [Octopus vulgaris]
MVSDHKLLMQHLKRSFLCNHVEVVELTTNLRLLTNGHSDERQFANYLLDVGNGNISVEQSLDNSNENYGTFTAVPNTKAVSSCLKPNSSLTHSASSEKSSLSFNWTSPMDIPPGLHFKSGLTNPVCKRDKRLRMYFLTSLFSLIGLF